MNNRDTDIFTDEIIKKLNDKLNNDSAFDKIPEYVSVFEEERLDDEYHSVFDDEEPVEHYQKPKRRKHTFLKLLLSLAMLAAAVFLIWRFTGKQPIRETPGLEERTPGISTVLIVGTDDEGYRTDTIILASIDANENTVSLLSIPRDTYIYADYYVPKINSACGYGGGGAEGMEELMTQVSGIVGFMPDGYVMVDLNAFVEIVDIMGGVNFDVPVDMFYEDPYQDLYIDLDAGLQHLDGQQAMGLVRFRSGYAMADLERVNVQRDFIAACMEQWLSPKILLKMPKLLSIYNEEVTTDLSVSNMIWIMKAALSGDGSSMTEETLPGWPEYIDGGSYYLADESAVKTLMAEKFSPYK